MNRREKQFNLSSPVSSSYVDPHGRLFREKNGFVRAIFEEHSSFYRSLFSEGIVAKLVGRDLLVETQVLQEVGDKELLVGHAPIDPVSYPFEWSPSMLKDAALKTLHLVIELLDHDLTLQDGTPYNVVFDCCNPVFVDFTSISRIDDSFLWKPYDQFLRLFYLPLLLYSLGAYDFSRMALYNYHRGLDYSDMRRLLPLKVKLKNSLFLELPYFLDMVFPHIKEVSVSRHLNNSVRKKFFLNLLKKVEGIRIKLGKSTWTDYWDGMDNSEKYKSAERILRTIKPRRVLDIGANTGQLAFLAAREGSFVLAIDSEWECTEMLYAAAKVRAAKILPLCIDVLVPTPSFGWNLSQYDDFFSRFKADLVIMAAIIHHLILKQWQDFDRVLGFAAKITDRYLLVEYVDGTDEMCRKMVATIPSSYTKQDFLNAIEKYFRIVTEARLTTTRTFILCEKL